MGHSYPNQLDSAHNHFHLRKRLRSKSAMNRDTSKEGSDAHLLEDVSDISEIRVLDVEEGREERDRFVGSSMTKSERSGNVTPLVAKRDDETLDRGESEFYSRFVGQSEHIYWETFNDVQKSYLACLLLWCA